MQASSSWEDGHAAVSLDAIPLDLQRRLIRCARQSPDDRRDAPSPGRAVWALGQDGSLGIDRPGADRHKCRRRPADGARRRSPTACSSRRCARAPVAGLRSEELAEPALLDPDAPLALAIDPLDGSSNIDANVSIGTIFSILPVPATDAHGPAALPAAGQPAARRRLLHLRAAARAGADARRAARISSSTRRGRGDFVQAHRESVASRAAPQEFAINASNYRHWDEPSGSIIDDCLKGATARTERDFNMRWVASLVAEAYRILMRGGIFLYPADQRAGLRPRPPASGLRGQPGGHPGRAGRRGATERRARILDIDAAAACTSACRWSSARQREVARIDALPHRSERHRRALAAVRQSRPVPSTEDQSMSVKYPIISVTGSSGAGTTSVKRIFEQIFRREKHRRRLHRRRRLPSLRPRRNEGEDRRGGKQRATTNFTPLRAERQRARRAARRCSSEYGRDAARARPATMSMTKRRRRSTARRPAPSPNGSEFAGDSDLLFYEGLHGCVVTDKVNVARHADLKIGVVPVINLEWIQKIHRDRADARLFDRSGDGHDPAAHAGLCPLHLPAVHARRDINFQRVPIVDTSNPFIARWIPTAGRIDGGHPLRQSARHRFPLPAVDDPRQLHVAGQFDRDARQQARSRHAADPDAAHPATDRAEAAQRRDARTDMNR